MGAHAARPPPTPRDEWSLRSRDTPRAACQVTTSPGGWTEAGSSRVSVGLWTIARSPAPRPIAWQRSSPRVTGDPTGTPPDPEEQGDGQQDLDGRGGGGRQRAAPARGVLTERARDG